MTQLTITNCRFFDSGRKAPLVNLEVENGKIIKIGGCGKKAVSGETLDAGGRMVAPGLIDVHIQGAGGADVLDGTKEALETISKTCARFGVSGFLATTVYRPGADNRHLEIAAECSGADLGGARLLGIHLEGPFISPAKRGMIQPLCICKPSLKVLNDIERLTRGTLRMMTIAPELDGSLEIIRRLADNGVIASFGHSAATYEQTLEGIEAGITHVTHLLNAMSSLHHRTPGPLLALADCPNVSAQIIADGVHLHPRIVKLVWEMFGQERCVVITDGMQAMGLPDGSYVYNGIEYKSENGAARYRDGTLIGTAVGLSELALRLQTFSGCSPAEAINAASRNPARILGLARSKGKIARGFDADLILFERDGSVWVMVLGGNVIYP